MISKSNKQCLHCKDRRIGCHCNCEAYSKFHNEREIFLAVKKAAKNIDSYYAESIIRRRAVTDR